ncbi:MAG: hypothetical protein KDC70_00355 [Saprospiraceae bacterium]|nr:hypothetical protein [Saprospiraceae bacterium]
MRYLVTTNTDTPFYTAWFDPENHWSEGMVVYDLIGGTYTTDGYIWLEIEKDAL